MGISFFPHQARLDAAASISHLKPRNPQVLSPVFRLRLILGNTPSAHSLAITHAPLALVSVDASHQGQVRLYNLFLLSVSFCEEDIPLRALPGAISLPDLPSRARSRPGFFLRPLFLSSFHPGRVAWTNPTTARSIVIRQMVLQPLHHFPVSGKVLGVFIKPAAPWLILRWTLSQIPRLEHRTVLALGWSYPLSSVFR